MDPRAARQQARIDYSLGSYSFWSAAFEPSSKRLVDVAGVSSSMRVLDVAAGDGNTSLAAVRRGATVTAVDITPAQVRRGRMRTQAEGSTVQWVGMRTASRSKKAASTAHCARSASRVALMPPWTRVVRPGGVVGFTEWTGEGVVGALEGLQASFATPREERHEAMDGWGNERFVRSRLEPRSTFIDVGAEVLHCRSESVDRFCADCWRSDPEMRALDQVLSPDRRLAFLSQLRRLVADWNTATDGSLIIELNYLLSVARKPQATAARGESPSRFRSVH